MTDSTSRFPVSRLWQNHRSRLLQAAALTALTLFGLGCGGTHSSLAASGTPAAKTAQPPSKTELTWYGHAAFKLVTPQGHVLLLDPWLTNPANPQGKADLAYLDKADLILITHGHFDHVGDGAEIARKTHARLVATFDLGNALTTEGGFPKESAGMETLGNFGGTLHFFNNEVSITFIPAIHSSGFMNEATGNKPVYAGNPGGFLITLQDGPTFYDTGDTDVFGDMALIPTHHPVDVMLACIGDHFTMGPAGAAQAIALVKPKIVIPMHYGTFPILTGTPSALQKEVSSLRPASKTRVLTLKVDQTVQF